MWHSPQARCTETSASFYKTYWLQDLLDLLAAGWPRQLIRSLSRRLSRRSGHGAHCALLVHASSTPVPLCVPRWTRPAALYLRPLIFALIRSHWAFTRSPQNVTRGIILKTCRFRGQDDKESGAVTLRLAAVT